MVRTSILCSQGRSLEATFREMIQVMGHVEASRVGTTALAAFLASMVECVEALTVVLAVGSVRGWRSALAGAARRWVRWRR